MTLCDPCFNRITASSSQQRVFHFMYLNLKHRQLQNGSYTSPVGFLSEKKQLRLVSPQADKSSSVSHGVMDDD